MYIKSLALISLSDNEGMVWDITIDLVAIGKMHVATFDSRRSLLATHVHNGSCPINM